MATIPATTTKKPGDGQASIEAAQESATLSVAAASKGAEAAEKGFEQTVTAAKEGVAETVNNLGKTQAEVKANMEKAMKTAEELVTFGQGNIEAVVKAGQIWTSGVQDLGKHVAASAQAQLDQTVATWKALAAAKSLKDALEVQTGFARTSMEKAVAETGRLTDASLRLAEQTMAPITARVTLAMEKFGRTAA
jgi:phasin family protein